MPGGAGTTSRLGRAERTHDDAAPAPRTPPQAFAFWGGGADTYQLHIDEETGIALRAEASFAGHVFRMDEATSLEVDPPLPPGLFDPHLDPHDVLYRKGDIGPGWRAPSALAVRYADREGFDLVLPQPLPPGASLRVWKRPLTDDFPGGIRVQLDLASGRHLVLFQYAARDASAPATIRARTALDVSGTADPAETESLLALLAPAR